MYIYIYMILTIFKHSPLYILLLQSISLSCAAVNHGFFFLSRKGSCNLQIRILDHLVTKCTGLIHAMIYGAISWILVAPVAMAMGLLHGMLYQSLSSIVWIAYKVEYGSKLFFQFFFHTWWLFDFFLSPFHECCKNIGFVIIELMKEIHLQMQLMKSRHEHSLS